MNDLTDALEYLAEYRGDDIQGVRDLLQRQAETIVQLEGENRALKAEMAIIESCMTTPRAEDLATIEQLQGEAKENEQQILGDMKRIRQLQAALKSIRDDKRVGWVDRFRVTASKALAPPKEETDE